MLVSIEIVNKETYRQFVNTRSTVHRNEANKQADSTSKIHSADEFARFPQSPSSLANVSRVIPILACALCVVDRRCQSCQNHVHRPHEPQRLVTQLSEGRMRDLRSQDASLEKYFETISMIHYF